MFVLIWVIVVLSARGSGADGAGASVWGKEHCQIEDFCVTLKDGDVTAATGLCAVIPCSFTTATSFTPKYLVWFKCEQPRCVNNPTVFNSNKNNGNVQSEFSGRVSLLEPDISQKNCSIMINDLRESDSGSYQFRVVGRLNDKEDGFTYLEKTTLSLTGLLQKPTVMVPPLTEGQQSTLTCTAPGLCSGSLPQITWTWRGKGQEDSHLKGNITEFHNETLSAVTQRHSSTLTFNPSAKHHDTNITCKISFTGNVITEETVTLNVTYYQQSVLPTFSQLMIGISFLTVMLLSAVICCLAKKCCSRKHQKNSGGLNQDLEMISQDNQQIHPGQAGQDDQSNVPEGAETEAVAAEKTAPEFNTDPTDVLYAKVNFLPLNKGHGVAATQQENSDTEYADVKIRKKRDDDDEKKKKEEGQEVEDAAVEVLYATVKKSI